MKYISGQYADLEMVRFEVEQLLGYPKLPDVIGPWVKAENVIMIEHAQAILEAASGHVLTIDDDFERVAQDARLNPETREFIAAAMLTATDTFEPAAAPQ